MPSGSWMCWGNGLVGSASNCIRTRRASSTSARSLMAGRPQTARRNRSTSSASPTRGKSRGRVRRTTAKSRFARSLAAVKEWCRTNRHRPAREQRAWLSAVLNGHYAYYGITGNIRRLQEYRNQVERIWHKWLERRTRGRVLIWANFKAFLARHPLPVARIIHRYTSWNESLA